MNEDELSEDTNRMLHDMYSEEELAALLIELGAAGAWMILAFNDPPFLEPVDAFTVRRHNWRLN